MGERTTSYLGFQSLPKAMNNSAASGGELNPSRLCQKPCASHFYSLRSILIGLLAQLRLKMNQSQSLGYPFSRFRFASPMASWVRDQTGSFPCRLQTMFRPPSPYRSGTDSPGSRTKGSCKHNVRSPIPISPRSTERSPCTIRPDFRPNSSEE